MKYLRWLLFPFSLIYGLVVIIRNWCYDAGSFKSYKFTKPVISVGNLDVGGAGKSPMTEYLIRLLKDEHKLATLSRGYGRETKGYIESGVGNQEPPIATAAQLGDEPAQFHHKFPDITVAVCEKRAEGIKKLIAHHDIIVLDDAFQHRAVEPGLSILLFDYNRLNEPHLMLPAGNLREPFSGRWRAQIMVISKCPKALTDDDKAAAIQRVAPLPYQKVFFTSIAYQSPENLDGTQANVTIDKDTTIFVLTGIANARPLLQYIGGITPNIIHHNYPDHHQFTLKNIAKLASEFSACPAQKKLIITTEKDAQRLDGSWFQSAQSIAYGLSVFVIPIKVEFLDQTGQQFDQLITDYVREHTTYNSIH